MIVVTFDAWFRPCMRPMKSSTNTSTYFIDFPVDARLGSLYNGNVCALVSESGATSLAKSSRAAGESSECGVGTCDEFWGLWLTISTEISVVEQKTGGEFFQPIGRTKRSAI